MKIINLIILIFNLGFVLSQESVLVNTERLKGKYEEEYINKDSSISIKTYNKQGGYLMEIKNFTDFTKKIESGEWFELL